MNVGVYILNVIVNNGSEKTAYETILIILAPDQMPVEKTEITKIIQKTKVFVEIDFREEKKCQDGYSYNNKTNECECEKINVCIGSLKHTDKGCQPLPRPEPPITPMPPTPEPTDRCWDISAGKPMEDCEEEQEETANCGGEPCTPDEKEDTTTEPREEESEEEEQEEEITEPQPQFGEN